MFGNTVCGAQARRLAVLAGAGLVFGVTACDAQTQVRGSAETDASAPPMVLASSQIEAGRYLVEITGCNDCHTDGYAQSGGVEPPESERLLGRTVGFGGPWGVTWPDNLRLTVADMTEDDWVTMLETRKTYPPMPWHMVAAMSEPDQRAIYAYLKSLGPAGEMTPDLTPPGETPPGPYEDMTPVQPKV